MKGGVGNRQVLSSELLGRSLCHCPFCSVSQFQLFLLPQTRGILCRGRQCHSFCDHVVQSWSLQITASPVDLCSRYHFRREPVIRGLSGCLVPLGDTA